jgi:predicted Zn-dependent peptidase
MTSAVESVTAADVQRVANELFQDSGLAATVVGPAKSSPVSAPLRVSR